MRLILFISFLILQSSCFSQVDYRNTITSQDTFDELKGYPNTNKFGKVDAVKVLLDLKYNTLYFLNANKYRLHVDFCNDVLGYGHNGWKFNVDNYDETGNRDFLLGTVNHFKNHNKYVLEFSVADNITPAQINKLHKAILLNFELSSPLYLFLNTARMSAIDKAELIMPTIEPSEIYEGLNYQGLNPKEGYGVVTFVSLDRVGLTTLSAEHLVIIDGTPNDLPPVAGVITSTFQTPLSHITLLCMNRGTPMAAQKDVWNDSLLRSLEGLPVWFKIGDEKVFVEETTMENVEAFAKNERRQKPKIILQKDTLINQLILPEEMKDAFSLVGGKAAHFGMLYEATQKLKLEAKLPEDAFAIPFSFYEEHIKVAGAQHLIRALPEHPASMKDSLLKQQLEFIQFLIKRTPISPELLKMINRQISSSDFETFRFRSSTNAEDIDGFNGAGLYTSKSGVFKDVKKTFEKAIQNVWASTWSYRAFMERSYFDINQPSVSMAILCHRSFPDEEANGVVITKNLYRENYRGFVINAQFGEVSVVKPPKGVTCEQFICYSDKNDAFFGKKNIVEYISYSSLNSAKESTVLGTKEVVALTQQVSKIKKYMYHKKKKELNNIPYHEYALDFEFKLVGQYRELYIKQMRPF